MRSGLFVRKALQMDARTGGRWRHPAWGAGVLAGLFLFFVLVGLRGVDFGRHWDESKLTDSLVAGVRTGSMLPGWYNYPSVCYDLGMLALLPGRTSLAVPSVGIAAPFTLPLRGVFLVVSSLALLWTYMLIYRWRRSAVEALLGAALLGGSWEFMYHARWVAPDCLMAQFGVLAMLLMYRAMEAETGGLVWLRTAALMAGLCCGTKYPGGILILPLLLTVFLLRGTAAPSPQPFLRVLPDCLVVAGMLLLPEMPGRIADRARTALMIVEVFCDMRLLVAGMLAVFLLVMLRTVLTRPARGARCGVAEYLIAAGLFATAFVASTPGAVVETQHFLTDVVREIRHYQTFHGGYSVDSPLQHAWLMLQYLALVSLSAFWPVSLVLFLGVCAGIWAMLRRDGLRAVWFLTVPAIYGAYFCGQKVMIVRNLMLLLPFMAVLGARGICSICRDLPYRRLALSGIAVCLLINLGWAWYAAETIRSRNNIDHPRNILAYLERNPDGNIRLTKAVRQLLPGRSLDNLPKVARRHQPARYLMFSSTEVTDWTRFIANRYKLYRTVSGVWSVNFDYYPTWKGDRRILVVEAATGKRLGLWED